MKTSQFLNKCRFCHCSNCTKPGCIAKLVEMERKLRLGRAAKTKGKGRRGVM